MPLDSPCPHCARLAQVEAELEEAKAVLRQVLAQTHIAMENQRIAEEALVRVLHPSPDLAAVS